MAYNINEYLDKEGLMILWGKIKERTIIDDEINDSSKNPVQNEVIYKTLQELYNSIQSETEENINNAFNNAFPVILNILTQDIITKKGTPIDVTINWEIKKNNQIIIPDKITINDEEIDPSSTSKTYSGVNVDTTYYIQIWFRDKDNYTDGFVKVTDGFVKVLFVNPKYVGKISFDKSGSTIIQDDILSGNEIINTNKKESYTYNLANEKSFYAYPSSYGNLEAIIDKHDLDYINSYEMVNMIINGKQYNIYILLDATTINDFVQNFK